MENKSYRIQNLSDFVAQINSISIKSEPLLGPSKLLFRGHSDKNFQLVPTVGRYPSPTWLNSWQMVEKQLVESAQQKFPMIFQPTDYPAILLAKLQHYGIMTRMLDLTRNAFVALYFACKNKLETDGEVLAFSAKTVSAYNPYVNAIADTYRLTSNAFIDVESYFYKVKQQPYYSSYLYSPDIVSETQELDGFVTTIARPIFVEVGNICERQKNQEGYFLLFPNKINFLVEDDNSSGGCDGNKKRKYCSEYLVQVSKDDEMVVKSFIIPHELKQSLLNQLTRFGVTDEFLFSDNVDEVCKGIVSEYRQYFVHC